MEMLNNIDPYGQLFPTIACMGPSSAEATIDKEAVTAGSHFR